MSLRHGKDAQGKSPKSGPVECVDYTSAVRVLKDIAILTDGQVIAEELGLKLKNVTISDLGQAKSIKIDKDNNTIIDGGGVKEKIKARQQEIRSQIEKTTSDC